MIKTLTCKISRISVISALERHRVWFLLNIHELTGR